MKDQAKKRKKEHKSKKEKKETTRKREKRPTKEEKEPTTETPPITAIDGSESVGVKDINNTETDRENTAKINRRQEDVGDDYEAAAKHERSFLDKVVDEKEITDTSCREVQVSGTTTKDVRRETRKRKKEEKEDWLKQVPKVDEHGIAYTKIQIRRMLKRVKRGLIPIPTKEEEQERIRQERELRKEEEAELAGMLYKKQDESKDLSTINREDDLSEGSDQSQDDYDDEASNEGNGTVVHEDGNMNDKNEPEREVAMSDVNEECPTGSGSTNSKKKARRNKPVPKDYICQTCQNRNIPAHWIYDCVDKVTVKGTNQKAKRFRGLHEPDCKKVFVSGLPFDVKPKDVEQLFASCGVVKACKLIKFEDTGRCKGQAYLSFATEESAKQAMRLSGTKIDNVNQGDDKKKDKKKKSNKGNESSSSTRSQLTLKVTKVLNRRSTSKKAQ